MPAPARARAPLRRRLATYIERLRADDPACVEVQLACEGGGEQESLDDGHVRELAAALRTNTHARAVNAWGNTGITDAGAEALLDLLIDNVVLDRINLDLTGVSDALRSRVQQALLVRCLEAVSDQNPDQKHVHTLDLSRRDLCDADVEAAAEAVRSNPFVTALSLWGNPRVTDEGLRHVLDVLHAQETLVSVSLDNTNAATTEAMRQAIASRVCQSRQYKALCQAVDPRTGVINLANASLTASGLQELAQAVQGNRTLTSLLLTGNREISDASINNLISALDDVPYLATLAIDAARCSQKTDQRLRSWKIKRMASLIRTNAEMYTKVDFSSCPLKDNEWPGILDVLRVNSVVVSLNLGESKLTEASVRRLLDIIPTHASLARVQLNNLKPTDGKAHSTGGDVSTDVRNSIAKALRERTLERARQSLLQGSVVSLDDLQYVDASDRDLKALAPAVAQSTSLTALTLRCGGNVSAAGVTSLLGDVRQRECNTRLTRLNLVYTQQSEISLNERKSLRKLVATRALSQALCTIRTEFAHCKIDLSDHGLRDEEILNLCSAIGERAPISTLELDLSTNPITNRGALALLELVETSACVLRIDLRGSVATGSVRRKIEAKLRVRAIGHASRLLASSFHPPMLRQCVSIDFLQGQELRDADVIDMAGCMAKGNMVEAINISNNVGITDAAGSVFLEALRTQHATVHTLHLHGTGISSKMANTIQKQLDQNALRCCLAELQGNAAKGTSALTYMRNRGISDKDVTKIARALVPNEIICHLDLSGNIGITDASVRAFEAAVTNKDYRGILNRVAFNGTSTTTEAVNRLHAVLESLRPGESAVPAQQRAAASEEQATATTEDTRNSQWTKIRGEIRNVEQLITDMVHALELEKEGASSASLSEIPVLPPLTLDASRYKSVARDLIDLHDPTAKAQSADKQRKAILQRESIGVRLKFSRSGVNMTKDGLSSILEIPLHCVQIYPNAYDPLVCDVRLYDVSLNPNASVPKESCHEVAARLFSHCQNASGLFCRQYNSGLEIFCHYPWALAGDNDGQDAPETMGSGVSLASCIPHVMEPGSTEWESRLQQVFSHTCQELSHALSNKVFNSADIKGVCEQFAAQALVQLEKAAVNSSSLQRYMSPEEERDRFYQEIHRSKEVCDEFLRFVRWIIGGGKTVVPMSDPEIEASLMEQWSYVQKCFGGLQQDTATLIGKNSNADPAFAAYLGSQENQAHETAKMLEKRCKQSLTAVGAELTDLSAEKVRRVGDINVRLTKIREERKKIAKQLERATMARHQDMVHIQQGLKSYAENGKRIIALSKEDDEFARAERDIENDHGVEMIDKQLQSLQTTSKDWKQGLEVAAQLETSIQTLSQEIQELLKFEGNRLDRGIRDLSLKLFKDSFYPVYVLSLLETERIKYSIAIDRTEADRTTSWSNIYHPVGKLRKPRIAHNAWTNIAAPPHSLVAPSPYPAGSNALAQHSWGASYEQQRNSMPVLAQLVIDMPFHSIQDQMEAFCDNLRIDVASALDCKIDCIEVHSVVAGSVVATIGLLSDRHAVHGDRSPLDLLSEIVRQAVDNTSALRSGKYTRNIKEVNHVPDSMADQSVHDQELRVASISDACDRIEKHSGPVWVGMKQANTAVTVCEGSDTELLVFRNTDTGEHVCIPHFRLVKPAISYEELIDEAISEEGKDFIAAYFRGIEKRMRAACAASKQFAVEYKEAAIMSKRTNQNVIRLRDLESKYNANHHKAEREFKRRDHKVRDARAHLEEAEEKSDRLEYFVKLAADGVIKAEKELAQRRVDWHKSEDELFDVRCLECQTYTTMAVPVAEARIVKSKQLYRSADLQLQFALWKRAARENAFERAKTLVPPLQRTLNDFERTRDVAQNEWEIAEQDLKGVKANLQEEKEKAVQQKHVLEAYRYISDSAPPEVEADKGSHWLIGSSLLAYRTQVQLTLGAAFNYIARDADSKSKFLVAVNEGILNLLTGAGAEASWQQEVQKRLVIKDVVAAVTGHTDVQFYLVRDNPDISVRFDEMLNNLQQSVMPTRVGAVPVQLVTGLGSTGLTPVQKVQVCDPLGCGQLGEVREADYEGRHVVVKSMHFTGAHGHVARVRTDHLAGELASQVSALCLASHPNILRVHGVCFEEMQDGPPFCGLVQDHAKDNLFDVIARHNAPHDENGEISRLELQNIFETLDPHSTGRVTQAAFVEGLSKNPWISSKLKIPDKVRGRDTLHYVWNYGTHKGSILDPPAEHHHPFGRLDRKGVGSFDLDELVLYYGSRELPEGKIAWPHRISIVVAVAQGMHYLLEHGLVHGNLKSGNVAIVDSEGGAASGTWMLSRIAVMDFGIPHLRRGFSLMPPFEATTPAWLPPERLLDPSCVMPQGDIWSFGVIMWEILTGEVPWPGKTETDLRELAKAGALQLPVLQKHYETAPAGYIDIMHKCMHPTPASRPNFHSVCQMIYDSRSQWRAEYLPG